MSCGPEYVGAALFFSDLVFSGFLLYKVQKTPVKGPIINTKKTGMVTHTSHSSKGGRSRQISRESGLHIETFCVFLVLFLIKRMNNTSGCVDHIQFL